MLALHPSLYEKAMRVCATVSEQNGGCGLVCCVNSTFAMASLLAVSATLLAWSDSYNLRAHQEGQQQFVCTVSSVTAFVHWGGVGCWVMSRNDATSLVATCVTLDSLSTSTLACDR